jgi:hypothetical protein
MRKARKEIQTISVASHGAKTAFLTKKGRSSFVDSKVLF